jgi:hypothetical protein
MPQIPLPPSARPGSQQFSSIPESRVQASPDAFGYQEARQNYENAMTEMRGLGAAQAAQTQGIWSTVGKVGSLIVDQVAKDQRLAAETKLGEFELNLRQELAAIEPTGDGSLAKTTLETFDKGAAKLKEAAGPYQGDTYEAGLARLRLRFQEEAITRETGAMKQSRIDNINKLADFGEAKVYEAPDTVDAQISEAVTKIEASGLTPSQKSKAIEGVNQRFRRVAIEKLVSDGNVAAARGILEAPGTVEALGGLEALRQKKAIEDAEADLLEKQEAVAFAQGLSKGTVVLDPEDGDTRKLVDKAWKTTGGNQMLAQFDPTAASTLAGWVKNHGVVPSSALSVLNAMAKNGSEDQRVYAYQMVNQMEAIRPGVVDSSGAKTGLQKDADRFRYYVEDLGLGQADALKRLEEMRSPEFKGKEDARRTDARKLTGKMQVSELSDAFDSSIWSRRPDIAGDPRRGDILLSTYKRAFEDHYIETGDEDQARTLAMKDLRRSFNVSSVSGDSKRVMKHPPELYYAPINGEHTWITEQLVADVKAATGKDIPADRIFIEANRATDEAITAAPAGQVPRPVYAVVYKDENGAYQTIPGKLFKPDESAARNKATAAAVAERQGLVDETEASRTANRQREERRQQETEIRNIEETANSRGVQMSAAEISTRLETGGKDPMKGVYQIVADTGNTKSYGNFGINSGGSAQQFQREHGAALGLTAQPGSAEFDAQWINAARANPQALHKAELEWYSKHIIARVSNRLENAGVPENIANDPRVQAYFADRSIQQGAGSIDKSKKHRERISRAADEADGNPVRFLELMTRADQEAVGSDFKRALKQGNYSERANRNRTGNRQKLSLLAGAGSRDKVQDLVDLFGFGVSVSMNDAAN